MFNPASDSPKHQATTFGGNQHTFVGRECSGKVYTSSSLPRLSTAVCFPWNKLFYNFFLYSLFLCRWVNVAVSDYYKYDNSAVTTNIKCVVYFCLWNVFGKRLEIKVAKKLPSAPKTDTYSFCSLNYGHIFLCWV